MPLKFISTQTVASFKEACNDTTIQIRQNKDEDGNPKTPFFTCGGVTGPVSKKGYSPNPMVSRCVDTATGEEIFLLHSRSDATVVATL